MPYPPLTPNPGRIYTLVKTDESPIYEAAEDSNEEMFLRLIEENINLETFDFHDNSLIHYATFFGTETMLITLLEKLKESTSAKRIINTPNTQGFTPLSWAILTHNINKASMLLAHGARPSQTITFKRTYEQQMLYPAPHNFPPDEMVSYDMLCLACMAAPQKDDGNEQIIQLLLDKQSIPTNGRCRIANETPLQNRARWGSADIVNTLLKKNADPLMLTQEGDNALHRAVQQENLDVVKTLLRLDKKVVYAMTQGKNYQGETPITLAQNSSNNMILTELRRPHYTP